MHALRLLLGTGGFWVGLLIVIGLLAIPHSASGDEKAAFETLVPGRELPFYSDLDAELPPAFDRDATTAGASITTAPVPASLSEVVDEVRFPLDSSPVQSKTPLPDWDQPQSEMTTPPQRSGFGSSMLWVSGLLAVGWLATKYFQVNGGLRLAPTGPLEILSRQSVGPQQQLILARLGQQVLLIGATPAGMSTLASVSDSVEAARLMEELRPTNQPAGPTMLDLFRSRRIKAAPLTNASLSTTPPRATPSPQPRPAREVTDV